MLDITRTIDGVPNLGEIVETDTRTFDFLYSVDKYGIEDMYWLSASQFIDFQGLIGERQSVTVVGAVNSPFEITGFLPEDEWILVRNMTPEEVTAIKQLTTVPLPTSSLLVTAALAPMFVLRWRKRRTERGYRRHADP